MDAVVLKPGREKSVLQFHPWIFSGAVSSMPDFVDGDICAVTSHTGAHLGFGYFNRASQIVGRMLVFGQDDPLEAVRARIRKAILLRKKLLSPKTTARRLVNAEGDFLPGLIVDQYDTALVIQISTLGMDRLKSVVLDELVKLCEPSWVVESSTSASRKQEGLKPCKETLYGTACEELVVQEGELRFYVNPLGGQKTGFFMDLSQMRFLIGQHSVGKKVLNCCSYTGAFSCHALQGGASHVVSVDISADAIRLAERNVQLNGLESARHEAVVADVFDFVEATHFDFDLVILDPPAFAKQKKDVPQAVKAYRRLNQRVLSKMAPGSFLLTCSCSYHIDESLFKKILFQAAQSAKRDVQILQSHRLSFDHPLSLYHPEGGYLKSFFLYLY